MELRRVALSPLGWGVSDLPGWGWQMPAARMVQEASALGAAGVEAGPPGYLAGQHAPPVVAGVVTAILHLPAEHPGGVGQVELEARRLYGMGARVLVLEAISDHRLPARDGSLGRAQHAALLHAISSVAALCARYRLRLAVHPHFGTALDGMSAIEAILVHSPASLCLDLGDLSLAGIDPVEVAELGADRIAHVHLKDVDLDLAADLRGGRTGFREAVAAGLFRPLGQGDVRIQPVLETLERQGYGGWYALEQDCVLEAEPDPGCGPILAARRSLAFLERA